MLLMLLAHRPHVERLLPIGPPISWNVNVSSGEMGEVLWSDRVGKQWALLGVLQGTTSKASSLPVFVLAMSKGWFLHF